MSEADPEQEAIETFRRALSAGLMGAGQLAESVARHREQQLRQAEAESLQRGQELERRFHAEHATARAVVADSRRPEFWEHARPSDVATAYEAAATWADRDPGMETDRRRIAAEVEKRYGVNVEDPRTTTRDGRTQDEPTRESRDTDPELVEEATTVGVVAQLSRQDLAEAAGAEQDHAVAERERAAALGDLGSTGATANTGAQPGEETAQEARYDSAEARLARAEALRATGMPEDAVQARSCADLGCSKPPAAAVESAPKRAQQSRTAPPGRTPGREQRRGLGG